MTSCCFSSLAEKTHQCPPLWEIQAASEETDRGVQPPDPTPSPQESTLTRVGWATAGTTLWGPVQDKSVEARATWPDAGCRHPVLGVWTLLQSSHHFPWCGFRLLSLQTRQGYVTDLCGGPGHSKHRIPDPLGISLCVIAGQLLGSGAEQGAMANVAPAQFPSARPAFLPRMCVACVSHGCHSTRAGKLTAAVCLQQSEPRRGSSKTRRDKEKQGCSSCGETFNSITKRKHHCKLCGAVSPDGRRPTVGTFMCFIPPPNLLSMHTDPLDSGPSEQEGRAWRPKGVQPRGLCLLDKAPDSPGSWASPSPPHDVTSLLVTVALPASFWTVFCPWVVGSQVPLSCRSSVGSALNSRLRTAGRVVSAKSVS